MWDRQISSVEVVVSALAYTLVVASWVLLPFSSLRLANLLTGFLRGAWLLLRLGTALALVVGLVVTLLPSSDTAREAGATLPDGWADALAASAQIIGGATAVVFALLAVPAQNAAGRYSPIFLLQIRDDWRLRGIFLWTLLALSYALAALWRGPTDARVVVASLLAVSVILALGTAARWVLTLLDPIVLARIIERSTIQSLPEQFARERGSLDSGRRRVRAIFGSALASVGAGYYPVPQSVVSTLRPKVDALLSVAAGAAQLGQLDVFEAALGSVLRILRSYLLERGTSAGVQDPLVTRVCEGIYGLSRAAQQSTNPQILPTIARAFGTIAASAVEVSTPGPGVREHTLAFLPLGYLNRLALENLDNFDSTAPGVAIEQLGATIERLLAHGLASSASVAVEEHLGPTVVRAMQSASYHLAGAGSQAVMRLWSAAAHVAAGHLVRQKVDQTIRSFLLAFRGTPGGPLEMQMAVGSLLVTSVDSSVPPRLPAAAAVATSFYYGPQAPDEELVEDAAKLGDTLVRELVWPMAAGEWRDRLHMTYAVDGAVEIAALLAGLATGTLARPTPPADNPEDAPAAETVFWNASPGTRRKAAESWYSLSRLLLGTCGRLTEIDSPRHATMDQWAAYEHALNGLSACILAALRAEGFRGRRLQGSLGDLVDKLLDLAEKLLDKWDEVLPQNAVIQHVRLIGSWLLAVGENELARRAARIALRSEHYRDWDRSPSDYWSGSYPTLGSSYDEWGPPAITISAQMSLRGYYSRPALNAAGAKHHFEQLVDALRAEEAQPDNGV